jgi:hypothetical protein
MEDVEKLKKLTGESDGELLSLLLEDAKDFVLSYTNRTELPPTLQKTVRDLAVIALNRMGTEGESSRSEGGESYSFEAAPKHIFGVLDRYRLVRIGGKAYEIKKESAETVPSQGSSPEKG